MASTNGLTSPITPILRRVTLISISAAHGVLTKVSPHLANRRPSQSAIIIGTRYYLYSRVRWCDPLLSIFWAKHLTCSGVSRPVRSELTAGKDARRARHLHSGVTAWERPGFVACNTTRQSRPSQVTM